MKLAVVIDGRRAELELRRDGETCDFRFQPADGEAFQSAASVVEVEPGVYSVLTAGRAYEVKVVPSPDAYSVDIEGRRLWVQVLDPRKLRPGCETLSAEGRQYVTAPMPGKVVRLLVQQGDSVQAGQGLLVVEAMKMQNEMQAPKSGRVAELRVGPDATVGAGETLAVIE